MDLPSHPSKDIAALALVSIFAMVLLTFAVSHAQNQLGSTGAAASGYGIPHNQCTTECQRALGPDFEGIPAGSSGMGQNHCVCRSLAFKHRDAELWP